MYQTNIKKLAKFNYYKKIYVYYGKFVIKTSFF